MDYWRELLWCCLAVAAVPALYGLHRLCLWLEGRGLLFYWHRKPDSSALSCLAALQKAVEPGVQHVQQVKEQKRTAPQDGAPGQPGDGGEPGYS